MALPVDSFEASVAALDLLFEKHELLNNSLHYWKVLPSYILLSIDFYFSLENTFSQNINYFAEGRIWLFIKLLNKSLFSIIFNSLKRYDLLSGN